MIGEYIFWNEYQTHLGAFEELEKFLIGKVTEKIIENHDAFEILSIHSFAKGKYIITVSVNILPRYPPQYNENIQYKDVIPIKHPPPQYSDVIKNPFE